MLFVGPTSLDGFLHGRGGSDRSGFQQSSVVAAAATIPAALWLAAAGARGSSRRRHHHGELVSGLDLQRLDFSSSYLSSA